VADEGPGLIEGTVIYEDGQPAKSATVSAFAQDRALAAKVPSADTDDLGHFQINHLWLGKFAVTAKKEDERIDHFRDEGVHTRGRGSAYSLLAAEVRSSLSAKTWRPNLKRVIPAIMPVTAASGPPMRIPSIRVRRNRLPTLPKDHCPSNTGSPQA